MNRNTALRPVLLGALVAVTMSGCAFLSEFLKASQAVFNQPSFNFKSLGLTDINLGGLNLDTVWQLDNPNGVSLSLASIEYALAVEDKQVVSGAPPQGLEIAANGSSDLHFPAGIKFQDLAQVVEVFLTKDTAKYRASGAIGLNTPIGVIKFPLEKAGDFEVPKVPNIVFGNPKVSNLSLTGATLEIPLKVTNKNSFPLPIGNVTGGLSLAGSNIGTLSTGDLGNMLAKGERDVTLPINVSFLSAAGALVSAIQGGNAPLKFDAQVQSGPQAVPVKLDQVVNFIR